MRITIENLPPIASGSFDLRPLSIFIGPNNTGKSRAALLPRMRWQRILKPVSLHLPRLLDLTPLRNTGNMYRQMPS